MRILRFVSITFPLIYVFSFYSCKDEGPSSGIYTFQPDGNSGNDATIEIPKSADPHQNYENIDLTPIIRGKINNPAENFGMMLKFKVEEPYKVVFLASSEHPDASIRPKLDIYWSKHLSY